MNSTVATSAMPIGMPGWPDLRGLDRVDRQEADGVGEIAVRDGDARSASAWTRRCSSDLSVVVMRCQAPLALDQLHDHRRQDQLHREVELARRGTTIELARDMKLSWIIDSR